MHRDEIPVYVADMLARESRVIISAVTADQVVIAAKSIALLAPTWGFDVRRTHTEAEILVLRISGNARA